MKDVCDVFKMTKWHLVKNFKQELVSVHHRNNHSLAIEMLHVKHRQSCEVVSDVFTQTTEEFNFPQNWDFRILSVNALFHGSESTSYLGPRKWEIVPVKTYEFNSPNSFKREIRNWVTKNRRCQHISGAGFLPWYIVVFFIFKVFALLFRY